MSQPGGRPARHEDDWWGQLYDDSTEDTGPTTAPDSVDDRFVSAKNTVGGRRGVVGEPEDEPPSPPPGPSPTVPAQRAPTAATGAPVEAEDAGADPKSWPWDEDDQEPLETDDDVPADAHPATRLDLTTLPLHSAPPTPAPDPPPPYPAPPTAPAAHSAPPAPALDPPPPYSAPAPDSPLPYSAPPAAPAAHSAPPAPALDSPPPYSAPAPDSPLPYSAPPAAPAAYSAPAAPSAPDSPSPYLTPPAPAAPAAYSAPAAPSAPDSPTEYPTPPVPVPDSPASYSPSAALLPAPAASSVEYVGSGPPTYDAEPTALPAADPDGLDDLVADTVLDGARYGSCTLRAVSQRGDSARYRGEPRRDALLTARFGTGDQALVLVAMATGARATPGAHRAAAEVCAWIARAVGRSHQRLTEDIQAARRGDLKSGLHRLTDRSLGKLRASAAEQGVASDEYAASLRCLLLPAHPQCRTRVFFGTGAGGLFRLRDGQWQDIEPRVDSDSAGEAVVGFGSLPAETPEGDRLTMDLGIPTPPSPYEPAPQPPRDPFLFRASVARPGDALVMCTGGLADPLRGEPALCAYLSRRWSGRTPPGLAAFLADAQVRVKGYADDRTAAAVWEA
ncbi:protein phosphatase 2C domain-containing protein [Streptomyces sp. NPDC051016]|uniref:protein phosphatase 2C domain-containing protein n=1 Tax=Streptomyces sp. NPDC051016 TaxID=3365638 RepID=UPI00378787AA